MNTSRRITLAAGAAAGGLLTAAFLPMAVAFADTFGDEPEWGPPNYPSDGYVENVNGIAPLYTDTSLYQQNEIWDTTGLAAGSPITSGVDVGYDQVDTSAISTPLFTNDYTDVIYSEAYGGDTTAQAAGVPVAGTTDDTFMLSGPLAGFGFTDDTVPAEGTTAASTTLDAITPFGTFAIPDLLDFGSLASFDPFTSLF